jgi:hypothetical protein
MDFFVCFESHEQFFSYLATVTITGDGAANLDQCLALTAFSSEDSFTCHTYCDTGPPFIRSYPKDPWFSLLNAVLLAKKQSLPILNVLGLTRPHSANLGWFRRLHQTSAVWQYLICVSALHLWYGCRRFTSSDKHLYKALVVPKILKGYETHTRLFS